jgi:hypothetical protein
METSEGIDRGATNIPTATSCEEASESPLSDDLNSGRVPVASVFDDTFSLPHRLPTGVARILRPDRIECLVSVAGRLDEAKFVELLDRVTSACFLLDGALPIENPLARPVYRDLLVAAELLAARRDVDRSHPAVRALIDALVDHALADPEGLPVRMRFSERCFDDTARIGSAAAAGRYLDFVLASSRLPDRGLPSDDARLARVGHARRAIREIGAVRRPEVEAMLLEAFDGDSHEAPRAEILALLDSTGGRRTLDRLVQFLHDPALAGAHSHFRFGYWMGVFRILEREDFAPELLTKLNENISRVFTNARIMVSYHATLGYFARCLHDTGRPLFEILEERGVQFWDYWMVYRDLK